jgi:hypothetical protein
MHLPSPRGPLSERVTSLLRGSPAVFEVPRDLGEETDPLFSEDLQLALFTCFELHYRGFDGVDDRWEWQASLIELRNALVAEFELALEDKVGRQAVRPQELEGQLRAIAAGGEGPSLSRYLEREATLEQFREFVIHRSIYHLREADPHTWVIPRLWGGPKAALIEIQADEYGGGDLRGMHSTLFSGLMSSLDLDPTYGAYVDAVPGTTLATLNLMSVFALQRRRRGAAMGHLALLEMDSSLPNRRYADGLRRLGFGAETTLFFDEHVEADSVHEAIAGHDLAAGLARQEPELAGDILFGAQALAFVEGYFADTLLSAWSRQESSLLERSRSHA